MIKKCNCKHKDQDKRYGQGMRVHNKAHGSDNKLSARRCTVCGIKREKGESA